MRSVCARVVEADRDGLLVGGDEHALQTALAALALGVDDVAQPQGDRLADRLLEVRRRAQAALEPGAGDLERVVPAHRVVVIELAADQARGQGDGLEIEAALELGRTVDGDAQRAAAELEVVEVEVQVGDDRRDQSLDLLQRVGVAHLVPSSSLLACCSPDIGPISKEGVDPRGAHAFGSSNFKGLIEYIGWRVVFRRRSQASTATRPPHREVDPVLRMSTMFLRTLREDPADAEVASHRLLVRAGYIRRAAPGGFTWLPIGWIVYRNVERVVREEMDRRRLPRGPLPGARAPRAAAIWSPWRTARRWTSPSSTASSRRRASSTACGATDAARPSPTPPQPPVAAPGAGAGGAARVRGDRRRAPTRRS